MWIELETLYQLCLTNYVDKIQGYNEKNTSYVLIGKKQKTANSTNFSPN